MSKYAVLSTRDAGRILKHLHKAKDALNLVAAEMAVAGLKAVVTKVKGKAKRKPRAPKGEATTGRPAQASSIAQFQK
jgi:hypothetical protein